MQVPRSSSTENRAQQLIVWAATSAHRPSRQTRRGPSLRQRNHWRPRGEEGQARLQPGAPYSGTPPRGERFSKTKKAKPRRRKAKLHSPAFKLRLVRSQSKPYHLRYIHPDLRPAALTTDQVREALLLPPENRIKPTCRHTTRPSSRASYAGAPPTRQRRHLRRARPVLSAQASPSLCATPSSPGVLPLSVRQLPWFGLGVVAILQFSHRHQVDQRVHHRAR